jgi:hypothetical protein
MDWPIWITFSPERIFINQKLKGNNPAKYMGIVEYEGVTIAVIQDEQVVIRETQDALDMMANARYQGADSIILRKENLDHAFFDLKTRLAGEILQKFSNYRMILAIVGDFSQFRSKSLNDFITESNRTGRVFFVHSAEVAMNLLSRKKS